MLPRAVLPQLLGTLLLVPAGAQAGAPAVSGQLLTTAASTPRKALAAIKSIAED